MNNTDSNRKTNTARLTRLILAAVALILLVFAFVPVSAQAASKSGGMKLPSQKTLENYVKKYVVTRVLEAYPEDDPMRYDYVMNTEALAKLSTDEKAKVVATMQNCYNGSFTSKNAKTSQYISKLSDAFSRYQFSFFKKSEAVNYFKAYSNYLNAYSESEKVYLLENYIQSYIAAYKHSYVASYYYGDYALDTYNQVLDMFTVIDGKLTSGAKKCMLVSEEDRNIKVGSKYGKHHVKVYMVTAPVTVKYTSLDPSTGKSKNYKTKYISIDAAVDKEMLKYTFTDAQLDKAVTVKTATAEMANKIHKTLMDSRELFIKIKGSKEKARNVISKLGDMVADINGGGYEFMYDFIPMASDSCTYVLITEDYGNVYKKCAEFYKRLEEQYKEKAAREYEMWGDDYEDQELYRDYLKYPDEHLRNARQCYDSLVVDLKDEYKAGWTYEWIGDKTVPVIKYSKVISGYDEPDTEAAIKYLQWRYYGCEYCHNAAIIKNETDWSVDVYTFEEFLKLDNLENILEDFRYWAGNRIGYGDEIERYNTSKVMSSHLINTAFKDLSDAEKLYVIDLSGLFKCVFDFPTDGSLQMVYTFGKYGWDYDTCADALQGLLDGKASGVCYIYSRFEEIVFRTLGFDCTIGTNDNINHAWTVVKIKNSAGKELWVPFDYGIGPATNLSVSDEVREAYLATEEMRYALYLAGIEGAPDYKNFTTEDFFN